MEKNFKQILKEQVILEFHQKGLDDLITFFVAKYPNFTYTDLDVEHLIPEYLRVYDIHFLASYIRYSDLSLLGSGMRDLAVKEKLYYLHYHIGTIFHAYRRFIWSDDITLEDLKRWLPLLSNFRLKNRIMRCTKISESFKRFVDLCLEENSFAYQNLILLDDLYSTAIIELERIAYISNQETFYKLLKIIMESGLSISVDQLLQCFYKLEKLLELIPIQFLSQYSFMIEEYLREFRYFPAIHNIEEFQAFRNSKEKAHLAFLENETDLSSLKEFYSLLFLGMPYQKFQKVFMALSSDSSKQYQLLKILYESIFPFLLKKDLYYQFMNYGSLRSYLEDQIKLEDINHLNLMLTSIDEERSLITMDHSSFHFIISSTSSYKSSKGTMRATIQNDTNFVYQKDCLFGYSTPVILSCDEYTCVLKRNGLKPDFLIAFDQVSFKHLIYQKVMGIPIVVIDTDSYVQKLIHSLEEKFASQDWISYIRLKKNLFFAIQKHPWLLVKYFTSETLYEDVRCLEKNLEIWILEKVPSAFFKNQLEILEQLILVNEELEEILVSGKKTSFQYRKKMLQYEPIAEL
ncbi:MAG: hypothetical protein HFH09_03970 [Bacilli bacterium]|nr:hypothetical protein [Bacilli bacterium]